MRRQELLKRISAAAHEAGVGFVLVREGRAHSVYACGGVRFTVPRHNEINDITARAILKSLNPVFGEGWWRQ